MARNFVFTLTLMITSLYITIGLPVTAADWNILKNQLINSRKYGSSSSSVEVSSPCSLKNYCESWRINVELNNIREFEVVPEECVDYIRRYMTSCQYDEDCNRAVDEVRLYLSSSCCCSSMEGDGKDAWIFDVDDTLLSTIPYYKKHGFGGEKLNRSCLEAWMGESKAPAIEASLKIFHEIKDKGLKIFLISSRRESLRTSTVNNLINVGYHGWSALILRGFEDENVGVLQYKAEARKKLKEEGYRIWGIMGDQWSSLGGLPSATRTFKLPNSIYYLS